MSGRDYAVLGPLRSERATEAFLGCEVLDDRPRADRPVVLIWLPDELVTNTRRLDQLLRDTALALKLSHPNLLPVHGVERFAEGWARITGYAHGEPLDQLIGRSMERGRPLPPELAARIVLDIAEAAHHAHEHGLEAVGRSLVHGGIRPETVLLGFHGQAILGGFGASTLAPNTTHGFDRRRWVAFLAPEQIVGGKASTSVVTDVYALGALLFTLLHGHAPFEKEDDIEAAVMALEPPALAEGGVALALEAAARRALAKRGSERPATARAFADAVLAALDGAEPTPDALAAWIEDLMPPNSSMRMSRAALLATADDPEAVTALSRLEQPPEPVDLELYAAARPTRRRPPARELPTVVEPPRRSFAGPVPSSLAEEAPTQAASPPFSAPNPGAAPQWASGPAPGLGGFSPPPAAPASTPAGAPAPYSPPPAAAPPRSGFVPAAHFHPAPPGMVYSVPVPVDPRTGLPVPVPRSSPAVPAASAGPTTGRSFLEDAEAERSRDLLTNQPVRGLPKSGPKRAEGAATESRITQFNRSVGDGSRALLYLVVLAAFGLLAVVVLAPGETPTIEEATTDPTVDRRLVRELLEEKADDEPVEFDAQEVPPVPVGTDPGVLVVSSEPPVDVFLDDERLGRTPLRVELPPGRKRLRLTDRKTGINGYRSVTVGSGEEAQVSAFFDTGELVVDAPDGARIFLNGRLIAKAPVAAPIRIYEGRYVLKVTAEGRRPFTERFDARPGQQVRFDVRETN